MSRQKRGWRKKEKEHDKVALRRVPVEPVKGVQRSRNIVHEVLSSNNPKNRKVAGIDKKTEEELRNQGKTLCGSRHPKNGLACVVPIDEHTDKHEAWNLTRGGKSEIHTKLQWNVK